MKRREKISQATIGKPTLTDKQKAFLNAHSKTWRNDLSKGKQINLLVPTLELDDETINTAESLKHLNVSVVFIEIDEDDALL